MIQKKPSKISGSAPAPLRPATAISHLIPNRLSLSFGTRKTLRMHRRAGVPADAPAGFRATRICFRILFPRRNRRTHLPATAGKTGKGPLFPSAATE